MVKDAFVSTQSLKGYKGEDFVAISMNRKEINKQNPIRIELLKRKLLGFDIN